MKDSAKTMMQNDLTMLHINLTAKPDTIEDDIYKIYSQIVKGIKKDDLNFEEFKGGCVNSMYKVWHGDNKPLVFRTFGTKLNPKAFNEGFQQMSDKKDQEANDKKENKKALNFLPEDFDINTAFFNRSTEFEVMNEVAKHGLCEPVFAKYDNGICYGYADGSTLNGPLMLSDDFLNQMASSLAKLHSIQLEVKGIKFKSHYERMYVTIGTMLEHLAGPLDQAMRAANEFPYDVLPSFASLTEDEKKVISTLRKIGMGDIVLCHNDLNQKNMIWNAERKSLSLIDFELCMNNYNVIEIGQLLVNYCGYYMYDFNGNHFPSEEYRKRFLRLYLEERNKIKKIKKTEKEFEDDLHKHYIQTNLTSLMFFIRLIRQTPSFDFLPDFYNNPELAEKRNSTKYFFGKYGYEMYQFYVKIKDEFMKSGEEYILSIKNKVED